MRADRLIALLLLLQDHGRMTATQLARQLEVSERTIYRDIDALSASGVPVYSDPGPGGGFALLDSYRTTLTGLTVNEIRALFMLTNIPAPLVELGVSQELKTALLKLSAALPQSQQAQQKHIRQRFYLDTAWWEQPGDAPLHLHTIHKAISIDRLLEIRHRLPSGMESQRKIEPYGLVAKAGAWYLVYSTHGALRVLQIAEILDARLVEQVFERHPDFDLPAYWQAWCAEQERRQSAFIATVRCTERLAPRLQRSHPAFAPDVDAETEFPVKPGWRTLQLAFPSFEDARQRLLGYGRAVEVLAPLPLRVSLRDYAEQIIALYQESEE